MTAREPTGKAIYSHATTCVQRSRFRHLANLVVRDEVQLSSVARPSHNQIKSQLRMRAPAVGCAGSTAPRWLLPSDTLPRTARNLVAPVLSLQTSLVGFAFLLLSYISRCCVQDKTRRHYGAFRMLTKEANQSALEQYIGRRVILPSKRNSTALSLISDLWICQSTRPTRITTGPRSQSGCAMSCVANRGTKSAYKHPKHCSC